MRWRFAVPAQETLLRNHKHADESVKHTEQRMYQRQASRAVSVAQPHRRLTAKTTGESPAAVSHWIYLYLSIYLSIYLYLCIYIYIYI